MFNRISLIPKTIFICLFLLLSICFDVKVLAQEQQDVPDIKQDQVKVQEGSVLNLIPQDILGLIYCPSLNELDNRINTLVEDLMPQSGHGNLLAQLLAGSFGAGFDRLDELEVIGLDMDTDFAVFFSNIKPMYVSATVHLTDPDAIMEVIEAEAEGTVPLEYNGINYWSTPDGSGYFLILGNILLYTQHADICNKVIDTQNRKVPSIIENTDKDLLRAEILNGNDQVGIYFNLLAITAQLGGSLEDSLSGITDNLIFQNDPVTAELIPAIENGISGILGFLDQLNFISVSLQVKDSDIQLKPFMKFKNDSEILNNFNQTSNELSNMDVLPNVSMINSAFQGVPKILVSFSTFWFDIFPKDNPSQLKEVNPLYQEVKNHYEALADRWNMSVDFKDYLMPNYLFIYELKDEESATSFMNDEFLEKLHSHYNAYAGEATMHNEVEIKSFIFPEFESPHQDNIPMASDLYPTEWLWHYAFTDGHLYFTTGTSDESIKASLDSRTDEGERFGNNPSYQRLIDSLGTDNNIMFAISPIIAVKNFMPILGKVEPESAAILQLFGGMVDTLPDNYSIGFSAKTHNNAIDAKLLLTLGDFKQLITMFGNVMGGFPMQ